jgi:hypothetical protein
VLVQIHDICRSSIEVLVGGRPATGTSSTCWRRSWPTAKFEILLGVYFLQKEDPAALLPFRPEIDGVFPGAECGCAPG